MAINLNYYCTITLVFLIFSRTSSQLFEEDAESVSNDFGKLCP